jgi:hypothetical protein
MSDKKALPIRRRAMELTLAWARHARIVLSAARDEVAAVR